MPVLGSDHRRTRTTASAFVAALLLVACGEQRDDTIPDDAGAGVEEVDGEEDAADDEVIELEEGEELAEATWMGEELSFIGVACGTLPAGENWEIRGRSDQGFYLQVRFPLDPDADDGDGPVLDSDTPRSVELFFDGDNGSVGDGEGYRSRDEVALEGLDASQTHVAGTLELEPDTSTRADEVNPDGGTLEFELRC